jgi:preprotein translocase subunit SecB
MIAGSNHGTQKMKEYPLRLERYFFTEQQVTANPRYVNDQNDQAVLEYTYHLNTDKLNGSSHLYGITIKISINQEQSKNPPYFFTLAAFGIVEITEDLDETTIQKLVDFSGGQLLIGVIRERLSDMTSRGPWGPLFLDFIPLGSPTDQ